MNSTIKILFKLAFAMLIAVGISSCLDDDDDRKTYSAAEETAQRKVYIDSLEARNYDIDTTANGLYYVVMDEGEGDFVNEGDTLTVGYAGYLINGTLFDTSEWHFADGKMKFILGEDRMIEGWEKGMLLMNEGAKLQLIIPSEHAYGSTGSGSIPPYQTLIFVIKLFEINPV